MQLKNEKYWGAKYAIHLKEKWLRDIWFVRKDDSIYQITPNEDGFLVVHYDLEAGNTEMQGINPSKKYVIQQKLAPGPSKEWTEPGSYQVKVLAPNLYLVKHFEQEMKFVIETTKDYPNIHHWKFFLPEIKNLPQSIRRKNGTVDTLVEVIQDTSKLDEILSVRDTEGFKVYGDRSVRKMMELIWGMPFDRVKEILLSIARRNRRAGSGG
jgi:hypothetical protein